MPGASSGGSSLDLLQLTHGEAGMADNGKAVVYYTEGRMVTRFIPLRFSRAG